MAADIQTHRNTDTQKIKLVLGWVLRTTSINIIFTVTALTPNREKQNQKHCILQENFISKLGDHELLKNTWQEYGKVTHRIAKAAVCRFTSL